MEKWTKGPWKHDIVVAGYGTDQIIDEKGDIIAEVYSDHDCMLCSSAPDLYAALKECVRPYAKLDTEELDMWNPSWYDQAVAALDKANGK